MELSNMLDRIRGGPQGPRVGAFFEVDGAVIQGSMRSLIKESIVGGPLRRYVRMASVAMVRMAAALDRRRRPRLVSCEDAHRSAHAPQRFDRMIGRLYPQARQLIVAHQTAGHTVVFITRESLDLTRPVAEDLGVEEFVCISASVQPADAADLDVLPNRSTAPAIKEFAVAAGLDLSDSYVYTHHTDDIELLSMFAWPTLINPLRRKSGISDISNLTALHSARHRHKLGTRVIRTVAGLAALVVAAVVTLLSTSGRDRQARIDAVCTIVPRVALRAAGVRMRITGAVHARSHRPAVFVFNHQSQLDALVVPWVLGHRFTGVVKKEARRYPVFGYLMSFIGVVFIDRAKPAEAIQALRPAIDTLRSGLAIAIAPEGQVTPSARLRPFKKGAFHLAIQTGVPIIPIVIHNSGAVLWRSSVIVDPGTIDVTVLSPVDTRDWGVESLDEHVNQVRGLFHRELQRYASAEPE